MFIRYVSAETGCHSLVVSSLWLAINTTLLVSVAWTHMSPFLSVDGALCVGRGLALPLDSVTAATALLLLFLFLSNLIVAKLKSSATSTAATMYAAKRPQVNIFELPLSSAVFL